MKDKLPYFTAQELLEIDRLMIEDIKVSVYQLMELAGFATAHFIRTYFKNKVKNKKVCIVCGKGNNGGDGLVTARFLANWQAKPFIILTDQEKNLKNVPKQQLQSLKALNIPILEAKKENIKAIIEKSDLIIDAIFGVGLTQSPKANYAEIIKLLNHSKKNIIAIDCPSGLDANTGKPYEACIKANATITMAGLKKGFKNLESHAYCGKIFLADIGIPNYLYKKFKQPVPEFNDIFIGI
ncbi:NAD(P)H-hydrate epimerase [Candidatus Margulisiibacteriota bacterium]